MAGAEAVSCRRAVQQGIAMDDERVDHAVARQSFRGMCCCACVCVFVYGTPGQEAKQDARADSWRLGCRSGAASGSGARTLALAALTHALSLATLSLQRLLLHTRCWWVTGAQLCSLSLPPLDVCLLYSLPLPLSLVLSAAAAERPQFPLTHFITLSHVHSHAHEPKTKGLSEVTSNVPAPALLSGTLI